jgi:hypothetical protein
MTDPVEGRLQRIEDKLDDLHQAMIALARIEERQANQSADTDRLASRVNGIEGRVQTLEGRTGWLPAVERTFWVAVAGVVAWLTRQWG